MERNDAHEEELSGLHYLVRVPVIVPRVGDDYQAEIPGLVTGIEYDSYGKNPIQEVPGEVDDSWNELEEAGFVLGLYIFGKNLVQIMRLIEGKTMGEILRFYYGKFYRSNGYRKWWEGRKMKTRKYVHGHRIFAGSRLHELLSRLTPFVSEENRTRLLQASKSCSEGKMSLEEYVSILKVTVGMKNLVEAVGIGKGKQDLTNCNNHGKVTFPVGKSCSELTRGEIVEVLNGDLRLSKSRSDDLFWECVWPRLLARGWQSELPKDYNYVAMFKNTLVFLVPGIMKFSRKLVKGKDYFESISHVLKRVKLDPSLIELESDLKEEEEEEEQRHCYLQPPSTKFMALGTSNGHEKPLKEPSKSKPKARKRKKLSSCTSSLDMSSGINGETSKAIVKNETKTKTNTKARTDMNEAKTKTKTRTDMNEAKTKEQNDMNIIRRQGTRNRPPTMRALEALANGYLTANKRC